MNACNEGVGGTGHSLVLDKDIQHLAAVQPLLFDDERGCTIRAMLQLWSSAIVPHPPTTQLWCFLHYRAVRPRIRWEPPTLGPLGVGLGFRHSNGRGFGAFGATTARAEVCPLGQPDAHSTVLLGLSGCMVTPQQAGLLAVFSIFSGDGGAEGSKGRAGAGRNAPVSLLPGAVSHVLFRRCCWWFGRLSRAVLMAACANLVHCAGQCTLAGLPRDGGTNCHCTPWAGLTFCCLSEQLRKLRHIMYWALS
jgi:hypothetical protein